MFYNKAYYLIEIITFCCFVLEIEQKSTIFAVHFNLCKLYV